MAQPIMMTTAQLEQLIEAVRVSAVNAASAAGAADGTKTKSKGSLSNCEHKFGGQRNHDVVEEFITQIATYKEIENISDEDALKGISLVFYGNASIWWQGVRKEAKTWDDVIRLIREHFSPAKPSYQVYMEIFEKNQNDDEAIDTFVCKKRALFAQLPAGRHDEETELDFLYGLLTIKYRANIARLDVQTFADLLNKGRVIELNIQETVSAATSAGPVRGAKHTKRCTYCNFRGHTQNECRKKKGGDNASN